MAEAPWATTAQGSGLQGTSGPEQDLCLDQRGRGWPSSPATASEPLLRGRGSRGAAAAVGAAVRCLAEESCSVQNRSNSAEADFQRQTGKSACAPEKGG